MSDFAPTNVLIVDDDDVFRETVIRALQRSSTAFKMLEAAGIAAAKILLIEHDIDCVLLDQRLGDGDAFGLIDWLRSESPDDRPPIILVTGSGDIKVAARAIHHGVFDVLIKDDLSAPQIVTTVERAVRLNRMERLARERQETLERLSFTDELTKLPNRNLFFDRLNQVLLAAQRAGTPFALLMMDLDLFKGVNDEYGHGAGDRVLAEVGQRLQANARSTDTMARLGGDEFAAILSSPASLEGALVVSDKLIESVSRPIALEEALVSVGLSVGIAIYPQHGSDAASLVKHADVALYAAKRSSRGIEVFEPAHASTNQRTTVIATDLRSPGLPAQLTLLYQPILNLNTGDIAGAEALLRWNHPHLGTLGPTEFIPAAERTNVIAPLTYRTLELAFAQMIAWHRQQRRLPLSINISARMLDNMELSKQIATNLETYGVQPELVTLEVTETGTMANPGRAAEVLNAIAEFGVSIAIDDFGTGYTSFRYLREFPVSTIKIDRMFINKLADSERDASIVESIVGLGRGLRATVVAEGIESDPIWQALIGLGCEFGQGYFFTPPLAVDDFEAWLDDHEQTRSAAEVPRIQRI